jgi:hypothetical protein
MFFVSRLHQLTGRTLCKAFSIHWYLARITLVGLATIIEERSVDCKREMISNQKGALT